MPVISSAARLNKINAAIEIRRDQAAAEAVDDPIAESLQKRHLAGRFLQLSAGLPPTFGQKIREIRHGAESEDVETDDVLQRRQIRPGASWSME